MQCNRKTACFAVTPHGKLSRMGFVTKDQAVTPPLVKKCQLIDYQTSTN